MRTLDDGEVSLELGSVLIKVEEYSGELEVILLLEYSEILEDIVSVEDTDALEGLLLI